MLLFKISQKRTPIQCRCMRKEKTLYLLVESEEIWVGTHARNGQGSAVRTRPAAEWAVADRRSRPEGAAGAGLPLSASSILLDSGEMDWN